MSAILDHLTHRVSVPAQMLEEPVPSATELEQIVQAALSAPDHGGLRPWRFLSIAGEAREQLGEVFAQAASKKNPAISEAELDGIRAKPLRSPLILTVIAAVKDHPKVSAEEQCYSAAAAAQNMLLAANALGYGAIWLTGPFATDALVHQQLGLTAGEQIVAFIYLGSSTDTGKMLSEKKRERRPQASDFLSTWPAE